MLEFNPEETAGKLTDFLQRSFAEAGFSRAVIALSGGVDSAVSCSLAVQGLGVDNVYPVLLPCGALNAQGVLDAMAVVEWLKIPLAHVVRIDIKPAVDAIISGSKDPGMDNVRRGNIMARVRMAVLFDQAKKRQAMVVGTENKSEHLLGYYTRFGDEASDIEPLRNLYKTQVYQLAKYLAVPDAILAKPPTAGLWDGQTDEGELGFSYEVADQILAGLYDEKKTSEELVASGFDQVVITKVRSWVEKNAFKHSLPVIPPLDFRGNNNGASPDT